MDITDQMKIDFKLQDYNDNKPLRKRIIHSMSIDLANYSRKYSPSMYNPQRTATLWNRHVRPNLLKKMGGVDG